MSDTDEAVTPEPEDAPVEEATDAEGGGGRRGRRGGGRAGRAASRKANKPETAAYLVRNLKPVEVLDEEGYAIIEANAEIILSEIGLDFREYPSALTLLADAGADVDGERVRFPKGMCREIVQATAPAQYTQHARNSAHNVEIGGNNTVFAPNYGSPFAFDLEKGRRYAEIEDFRNLVRLTYMLPHLHHSGGTVCEPTDIPVSKRHLDMVYSHIKYSDKPYMGSVTAAERAEDSIELSRIGFGGDLGGRTVMTSLINASSPLSWDATMLGAAEAYAKANQASIFSPFILAGAMAPATTAGVCAQSLAEALAGMTFAQLINPGCPVVFGTFAASMSMQSGAPTFGTPEPAHVNYIMAALARRLGVPFRSGGSLCASKLPDAQAAYESANTLQPAVLSGVNFMLHAAGWQEGGLSVGFEKLIMDHDQLGAISKFAKGVDLTENGQAMSAFRENEPGQHFLGTEHTLANFESAFYSSTVSNYDSYEQWEEEGSLDTPQRAHKMWKQMLNDYEAPPLDEAIDAELTEYMAKRKEELPDTFA